MAEIIGGSASGPSDTQAAPSEADTQALTQGTDGDAPSSPASEAAVQTEGEAARADGVAQQQARAAAAPQSAPPAPPALTEAQWREKQQTEKAEQDRLDGIAAAREALRDFRRSSGMRARDAFDRLSQRLGTFIEPEDRKEFLDLVEEANLKAESAAKLELGDSVSHVSGQLTEVSQAFYANLSEEDAGDFTRRVQYKDGAVWVNEFSKIQQATGRADALVSFVEAGAEALPEEHKAAFIEGAQKAESMADLAKSLYEAALRSAEDMPRGAPRGVNATSPGGGRFRDLNQLNAAKTAGQLTDQEYIAEQNRLLGVA